MNILITGAAGFIGYHLATYCLQQGYQVVGVDNINDYYEVTLKLARLELLNRFTNFCFYQEDLCHPETVPMIFAKHSFDCIVHLAGQAGVRYSISNPQAYIQANIMGFTQLIEAAKQQPVDHFIYASTSSVYGANTAVPFTEVQGTNHPLAIYAATKKTNELLAHAYSSLYQLPTTGLRFFTVYGPWGRPDMAFFKFTRQILEGKPIQIYNEGNMRRDFTYISDIVEGIMLAIQHPATPDINWNSESPDPASSYVPYRIYNLGLGAPVPLLTYIEAIEKATGKKAMKEFLPMQPGDVVATHADTSRFQAATGFEPKVNVEVGITEFVKWFRAYYQI